MTCAFCACRAAKELVGPLDKMVLSEISDHRDYVVQLESLERQETL